MKYIISILLLVACLNAQDKAQKQTPKPFVKPVVIGDTVTIEKLEKELYVLYDVLIATYRYSESLRAIYPDYPPILRKNIVSWYIKRGNELTLKLKGKEFYILEEK